MTPDSKPTSKTVVLIVEDDKFLQKILLMKFSAEGFLARGANDGEEAIQQIQADPRPDLVVLDLILPKKDGFEVLTEMRTIEGVKDIPVVVLSNLGQDSDRDRALKLGAIDFHVKSSLSIQEVIQKVRESYVRYLAARGKDKTS
jgi:DNA-binding response OmpR family regulator